MAQGATGHSGAPLLEIHLSHRIGSLPMQASLCLSGERSALFGPSGSGKSTLLRILAGLCQPRDGRVALEGRVLLDTAAAIVLPPADRRIGLVTQQPALFPHLSVQDNLGFGLRHLSPAEQKARIDQPCELFQLNELRSRWPATLSGGERQRVALVRAMVRQPRLLLLDEPFSALDGASKKDTWLALGPYLQQHNIATLLVSHDAAEVWSHADYVVRIAEGSVTAQGPPERILAGERMRALEQFGARDAVEEAR
ncbi:ATP-binding cassette domain-containing protein [Acidipila sp. EB88]|uniref:ATP-binding cassette domain-containing protein n=1 Tax=Acidipila sp. EB88 TaxID=2305226 RepID=UPI000F5E664D|nr:ATP-binding cassette domain-containing protein [Acidipila sp. EB88]